MKSILLSILVSLTIQCLPAQVFDGYFEPQKKKGNLPRKFVWVDGLSTAMKETEVTIGEYLFFIENISNDSSAIYTEFFIPSSPCILADFVLKEEHRVYGGGIPWFEMEVFNKKYNYNPSDKGTSIYDQPITGLSYEQAIGYAQWCSAYFNNYSRLKGSDVTLSFRLPSAAEFEKYSQLGMTQCYEKKKPEEREKTWKQLRECKNEKKCALCNIANKEICESNTKLITKFGREVYPVAVFFPNCFGVFDLQGNAAEMTHEKGIAKGGSYIHSASECLPEAIQNYSSPEPWLGFRLLVSVEKNSR